MFFELSGDNAAAIELSPTNVNIASYKTDVKAVELKTLSVVSDLPTSTDLPSSATVTY